MKNIPAALITLMLVAFSMIACGPSSKEAAKYNDALVSQEMKVVTAERELITALNSNMSTVMIDSAYSKLVEQLKKSTDSVTNAGAFDGSAILKEALIELFSTYSSVTQKEYVEFIKLNKISDTLTTMAEDYDKKIEITDRIDSLLNAAVDKFDKANDEFRKQFRIEFAKKEEVVTEEKKK